MALVTSNGSTNIVGKIGEVVYVPYKGGTYVRKAPTTRKGARTPAMLLNQQRFACMHRFCAQFKHTLIPQIWNDAATTNSGYNLFMKANSPAFAKDGSIAEPLLLKFSVGALLLPKEMSAQRTAPESNTIQVSWAKEDHIRGFRLLDELMVISSDGVKFSLLTSTGLLRKDLQGTFELPLLAAQPGYLYLFFRSEDRREFSASRGFKI
ncbi:MAG: hypothetical protein H7X84_01175 [Verrucomicrobia bacterium]|nr:hypothetical protein [Prolixibacteraceae bacterium]